jgi:hypothetical protein
MFTPEIFLLTDHHVAHMDISTVNIAAMKLGRTTGE